jgi:hypothetical protein
VAVTRRAALAAGAVAVVAGCDLDPRSSEPDQPSPTEGAPREPDADIDLVLLDQARAATARALAVVSAVRRGHPSLWGPLRPLAALHRAHAGVLDAPDDDQPDAQTARGDVVAALARVRRVEARLQSRLTGLAGRAGSGELARLLAGMGAGVAQHLAALPDGPRP